MDERIVPRFPPPPKLLFWRGNVLCDLHFLENEAPTGRMGDESKMDGLERIYGTMEGRGVEVEEMILDVLMKRSEARCRFFFSPTPVSKNPASGDRCSVRRSGLYK